MWKNSLVAFTAVRGVGSFMLGHMKCPTDGATLLMSERHSVEIDYCPECRGVWLDRGELDKILEQVAATMPPQPAAQAVPQATPVIRDERRDDRYDNRYENKDRRYDDRGYRGDDRRRKKRENPFELLGDIFGG